MLLQPDEGSIAGSTYVASDLSTILWGFLPNSATKPVATVASGGTVTFDTVSHEGILEDQGRDPKTYFGAHGVAAGDVLRDAIEIAASGIPHSMDDGPHVVTGPVCVDGAEPGDLLKVEVLGLELRAPYGVISNRHGYGCLAGEFPEHTVREAEASVEHPERFGSIHHFVTVEHRPSGPIGVLPYGAGRAARFALRPFLGVMGVAPDTVEPVPSVPPGAHGGNIDINLLEVGSTLYLPVQVEGALFYTGDPHFAQGDGEVALTALEAPLRATLRLTHLKSAEARAAVGVIDRPFVETDTHWVPIGLDTDLNEAMRKATRAAISFLETRVGMDRASALAYLSAAADFEISQVVDAVKGVHCCIAKSDFD